MILTLSMELDNKTYFIYNKSVNADNSYNNPISKTITIKYLLESEHKYFENEKAMELLGTNKLDIPVGLDYNVFSIYYFDYMLLTDTIKIIIISVDNDMLFNHFTNQTDKFAEYKQFLSKMIHYNEFYSKTEQGINLFNTASLKTTIKSNIENIIKKSSNVTADPTDPIQTQPDFTSLQMFPYQKKTVKWLINKEIENNNCYIRTGSNVRIGKVYYNLITQEYTIIDSKHKLVFGGGALIDEVGLGKTYQMIMLSLINQPSDINYIQTQYEKIFSKSTIIICPNHLCLQWAREIEKVIIPSYDVKVIKLFTKTHHDNLTYQDLLDADFVIVSFNFLSNQAYVDTWLKSLSNIKTYYKSKLFDETLVKKHVVSIGSDVKNKLFSSNPYLLEKKPNPLAIHWNRVIIDEFHEIYTNESYGFIDRYLKLFDSNYRWIVSGTPFDKSQSCLINIINFITNYKNTIGDNLLLDPDIKNYMETKFFRKNTKKSIITEHKLKPLKETVIWLEFSQPERLLYNSYTTDTTIDRFSVLVRQLCCHPTIVNELKETISNCKTLDDIEKIMVDKFKKNMNDSYLYVKYYNYRIKLLNEKIKLARWNNNKNI